MSSYEVGVVGVAGTVIAGPIVVGAAIALLAPAAGGYAIYKAGEAIHDELVREHQEALEKQYHEQALARKRLENAQNVRKDIIKECSNRISKLEEGDYWEDESISLLANKILYVFRDICTMNDDMDVVDLEIKNQSDIDKIRELMERLKNESKLISENKIKNKQMLSFIEFVESMFDNLVTNDYSYVRNVVIKEENEVHIKNLYKRIEDLVGEFYTIVNREMDRYGNVPISSVGIERIALLFERIKKEIDAINQSGAETWVLEERIRSLEKNIESYYTYKALLDIEQTKFLRLYLRYKQSCEQMGEEYKEAVEFDSYEELEATINNRIKHLDRMKKCSELYSKIGREAYVCMAFEIELNNLNYSVTEKKVAEKLLHEQLQNFRIGDKVSSFYEYTNDAVMQIFKVNDEVGLQLIIHKDGSSTMETIALNDSSKDDVVSAQKEHCKKSMKFAEALQKNWFITADFNEMMSAEHVSMEFGGFAGEVTNTVSEVGSKAKYRRELTIKERRHKNAEKARQRSLSLQY